MPASVTSKKSDLAAFECAQNVRIRRFAKGRLLTDLLNIRETGHGVQAASPDNANLCFRQTTS